MHGAKILAVLSVASAVTAVGCGGSDESASSVEQALQQELEQSEQRAADAEAERDELTAKVARLEAELDELGADFATTTDGTELTTVPRATEPARTDPATTQAAVASADPKPLDGSPYVTAFGDISDVALPAGEPSQVGVIATGTALLSDGSLPVVVRNNTTEAVGSIALAGTARDGSDALVGSGSDQGLQPARVEPGEVAFGYVYFGHDLPSNLTFAIEVTWDTYDADWGKLPVEITEVNVQPDQIVGIVTNESETEVTGPIAVEGVCFGTDGVLSDTLGSFTEQDTLPPAASGSFSIDFYGDAASCPRGLLGSSGYSF